MTKGKCPDCGKYKRNLQAHWQHCWVRKASNEATKDQTQTT